MYMIQKLVKTNFYLGVTLLIIVPFHALLSIYAYSIFGHYVLTRLFEEYILFLMVIIGLFLFVRDFKDQKKLFKDNIILLTTLYLAVLVGWTIFGYLNNTVNLKASLYGLLLDSRYLIFFLIFYQTLYLSNKFELKNKLNIYKLILYPTYIVVGFGLLQIFLLPNNFLSHFGYSKDTIMPFETVNHNMKYIRVMSTLRGANPLGAYLIFPISFIVARILGNKKDYKNYLFALASLIVLYFSYSRSAMLGLILSLLVIIYLSIKNQRIKKIFEISAVSFFMLMSLLFLTFRNNNYVQNILFHTQNNSSIKTTSDQGHGNAIFTGIEYIMHHPFGNGVGSAGQASVYNNHPAVISENYFLQIGEETGVVGMMLFVGLLLVIIFRLYDNRSKSFNVLVLGITSGLIVVSMLWFSLSDETLSFTLFGLLAIALSRSKNNLIEE